MTYYWQAISKGCKFSLRIFLAEKTAQGVVDALDCLAV